MSPIVRKRTTRERIFSSGKQRHERVRGVEHAVALEHVALVREVDRRQRDLLGADVFPARRARSSSRAGTRAGARPGDAAVVERPQLGPLVLRIPLAELVAVRRRCAPWRGRVSSSRRAPPIAASNWCASMASSSVDGLQPVARCARALLLGDPPASMESCTLATISRSPSSATRRSRKLDRLGEVVPGVDVEQREREARRPERLLGQAQQHERVLAAREQQARPLTLGRELAGKMWDTPRLRECGGGFVGTSAMAEIYPFNREWVSPDPLRAPRALDGTWRLLRIRCGLNAGQLVEERLFQGPVTLGQSLRCAALERSLSDGMPREHTLFTGRSYHWFVLHAVPAMESPAGRRDRQRSWSRGARGSPHARGGLVSCSREIAHPTGEIAPAAARLDSRVCSATASIAGSWWITRCSRCSRTSVSRRTRGPVTSIPRHSACPPWPRTITSRDD